MTRGSSSYMVTLPCDSKTFYLGFFCDVPCEGDGVVGNFFHISNCAEAFLVVSCVDREQEKIVKSEVWKQDYNLFPASTSGLLQWHASD